MSSIVGGVFVIVIISTAITYTTFSMNQITELAETIETKQVTDLEKTTEKYEIVGLSTTTDNQFNMTVTNTGDLPVHLNRLWVENTTDSSWPIAKYDLDVSIPTGKTVTNIGQGLGLTSLPTESYMMILVTDRGNTEKMFVNSVGEDSLYLRLRATPTTVPTTFTTTLVMEVINTGTNKLLNLQPEMDSAIETCTSTCTGATLVSGPTPTSFESLDPGDIATFEWVYSIQGDTSGDFVTFTGSLVNGLDEVSTVVTVQPVVQAENADVSLESAGVADDAAIDDTILLFHEEQNLVPTPGYQMMSSDVDGGGNGYRFDLETHTAGDAVSFFTNNGTKTIQLPSGNWNASLALRSEPVPTDVDTSYDLIFHMEDGDGVNPDNSEGDSSRDLDECGIGLFQERIAGTYDDAEQDGGGSMDLGWGSNDHELVYDGGNHQWIGLRWSLDVPQGAQINSADIRFRSDESQTGSSPDLIIGAEDTDDAAAFSSSSHNVDDRWDGTINSVTSATVTWDNIPGWSSGEEGSDTTTPDLTSIIQEIVDRPGWSSGNHIVIIIKDNSGGSNTNKRTAEHYDAGGPGQAARLTVSFGSSGSPDWQAGEGPHGSGAYYYDGNSMCHKSLNNISGGDGNDLDNNDNTTTLWFRTDGQVTSEQMLVYWNGNGAYPNSDYYKISLGSDNTGKVLFEYDSNIGTAKSTCLSDYEYDDGSWWHVVATRDASQDECTMYITAINGTVVETKNHNPNHSSQYVEASGQWYVATAEENGNYFKGWIDDIFHWNDYELSASEAADLARANYGTGAHQFEISLNKVDSTGGLVENLYNATEVPVAYQDSKDGDNNNDNAYSMVNFTMPIGNVTLTPTQRLNYSLNFIPSTSTWEALELDMKIDDTGFVDPYPSYLQTTLPSNPFPSYVIYDNDDELEAFVENIGDDGVYFVYQGTRVTFDGDNGAYSSFVRWVNGTGGNYEIHEDRDSIYIPTNQTAQLYFWQEPTDHPCRDDGDNCPAANIIPPGSYRVAIWVNGYSDQGETFGRSVVLGYVTVVQ